MITEELTKRILSSLILIPAALFFIIEGSLIFNFFILVCFLVTSYEWHNMSRNKSYYLFGIFFLLLSFYSAYEIRTNMDVDYEYFIIKGPKLTKISPNKTFSGVIGGYLLSIFFLNLTLKSNYFFPKPMEITFNIFIFILLISTVSQLGDIIISFFKRLSKIKDTGKIIPGHGGLLDRIDGMIFAFPFAYLIFNIDIFKYFR